MYSGIKAVNSLCKIKALHLDGLCLKSQSTSHDTPCFVNLCEFFFEKKVFLDF